MLPYLQGLLTVRRDHLKFISEFTPFHISPFAWAWVGRFPDPSELERIPRLVSVGSVVRSSSLSSSSSSSASTSVLFLFCTIRSVPFMMSLRISFQFPCFPFRPLRQYRFFGVISVDTAGTVSFQFLFSLFALQSWTRTNFSLNYVPRVRLYSFFGSAF